MPLVPGNTGAAPLPVLLQGRGIGKTYATPVLAGVDFELHAGEVLALTGENGAGKSTLSKIVAGLVTPTAGTLTLAGAPYAPASRKDAERQGVRMVMQELSLVPTLSVAENLLLGRLPHRFGFIRGDSLNKAAAKQMALIGLDDVDPRLPVSALGVGYQQMVEIARSLVGDCRLLILDEPTATLTTREIAHLFKQIELLKARGVAVVYISHRLDELQQVADRVMVLRDGRHIDTRPMRELTQADIVRSMVGRDVHEGLDRDVRPRGRRALAVRGLARANVVRDVSLDLHAGEMLGLAGLVGSGRTELARTLFGITPVHTPIILHGRELTIGSPAEAIANGLGYLPEDRRQHGVILDMSIASNITLASLNEVAKRGLLDSAREQSVAEGYRTSLRIKAPATDTVAGALSGGNQQKVALARWLAIKPGIMILDEPTQGVDVGSKSEIHELIVEFAERGMAVILISSELPEVLGMSDRIGVFHNGTIVATLSREQATQQKVMSLAFGHEVEA
jgi:ribose transport system ATP-binding protein